MDNPTADKIKTLARLSGLDEKEIAKTMNRKFLQKTAIQVLTFYNKFCKILK